MTDFRLSSGTNLPVTGVVIPHAARSVAVTTPAIDALRACGVLAVVRITAGTGFSFTVSVEGYEPGTDDWYPIITSAALTSTGTTRLRIHPALTPVTNQKESDLVPSRVRVVASTPGASVTYSVSLTLTP